MSDLTHPSAVMARLAESGLCECGCGQRTKLAARTNSPEAAERGRLNRWAKS